MKWSVETRDGRRKNDVYDMVKRRRDSIAKGEKHTPLHTLREILDGTTLTKEKFSALQKYHADIAPAPRIVSRRDTHYVRADVKKFLDEVAVRNATALRCVDWLKDRGLTQLTVAEHIGIDHSALSKFVTGRTISITKQAMDKLSALVYELENPANERNSHHA